MGIGKGRYRSGGVTLKRRVGRRSRRWALLQKGSLARPSLRRRSPHGLRNLLRRELLVVNSGGAAILWVGYWGEPGVVGFDMTAWILTANAYTPRLLLCWALLYLLLFCISLFTCLLYFMFVASTKLSSCILSGCNCLSVVGSCVHLSGYACVTRTAGYSLTSTSLRQQWLGGSALFVLSSCGIFMLISSPSQISVGCPHFNVEGV